MYKRIEEIKEQEKEVDYWIDNVQNQLKSLAKSEENTKYAYVSFEDIQKLGKFQPQNAEGGKDMFLVIKAPKGTILEVPEEKNSEKFPEQLYFHSDFGEILLYLVST